MKKIVTVIHRLSPNSTTSLDGLQIVTHESESLTDLQADGYKIKKILSVLTLADSSTTQILLQKAD